MTKFINYLTRGLWIFSPPGEGRWSPRQEPSPSCLQWVVSLRSSLDYSSVSSLWESRLLPYSSPPTSHHLPSSPHTSSPFLPFSITTHLLPFYLLPPPCSGPPTPRSASRAGGVRAPW